MNHPVSALDQLLASMCPELNDGLYVFTSIAPDTSLPDVVPIATFREQEGLTLIVDESDAVRAGLPILFQAAWITLKVHSDLAAVGMTAAVAGALGEAGISCNVVAAAWHDHIFVPASMATEAMATLLRLQEQAVGQRQAADGCLR